MLNDYTLVTAATVTATTDEAIAAADELVAAVTIAPSTYDATLGRLQTADALVADASGRGAFMARVHSDPDVRQAATAAEERLIKWGTDLVFRRDLYQAVQRFAATTEASALDGERRRLLDHTMRDFRRAGHELDGAARERLQRLRRRLVELEVEFGRNLDDWDDGIEMTRDQLAGLPPEYVSGLTETSDGRFRVSMAYPDYIPFMRQADDRDLRRQLQHKFWNRATESNRRLLAEAVTLRAEIAGLLGRPTWADFAMDVKMAGSPQRVGEFYESVVPGLTHMAEAELAEMTRLGSELGMDRVEPWDTTYLDNKQRLRDYGIDQNEVAAYFPLERVVEGMFDLTGDVFGLSYERIADTRAWHADVQLYAIRELGGGEPIAYFYADLFPREGKYGHAAAFSIRYGRRDADGSYVSPVAAIVANFTKPTDEAPSLLKHDEAVTLWHEFGHILHFCLTTAEVHRFSGYETEWDFVEAPSQIMENWMWEPSVLRRFARHYKTGEPIPTDLVTRLVAARDLNAGLFTMRQVYLGQLDLGMHAVADPPDLMEVYRSAAEYTLLPFHEDTFFPAGFGHLMGGYDAGYYGYLWARVYGDDMFSEFERHGITSADVGRRYRDAVLATGGTRDAVEHVRAFLGREPNSDAFLRRLGLATSV